MSRQNNGSAELEIVQKRSSIGRPEKQGATLKALGLGKIGRKAFHKDVPEIRGMINKVIHLVDFKEISKSGDK